jgi:Zn-finger nucleic acid-binding protein
MICPACKSRMIVVEYKNIELDWCHNCQGVWFDSTELELLLVSLNLDGHDLLPGNVMSSREIRSAEKKRKCPRCGGRMKKTNVGTRPQVLIDLCRRGHGLWFDGGELAQLLKEIAGRQPVGSESQPKVISFLAEAFKATSA